MGARVLLAIIVLHMMTGMADGGCADYVTAEACWHFFRQHARKVIDGSLAPHSWVPFGPPQTWAIVKAGELTLRGTCLVAHYATCMSLSAAAVATPV